MRHSAPKRRTGKHTRPLGTPQETPVSRARSHLEVQVHKVDTEPALTAIAHRVIEIWTGQRVYSVNAQFVCVEVIDLASGSCDPQHPFLGSRLVGGQVKRAELEELVFPVPTPGSEAVFQKEDAKGRTRLQVTSRVKRVILHVRRVRVDLAKSVAAWGKLTTGAGR